MIEVGFLYPIWLWIMIGISYICLILLWIQTIKYIKEKRKTDDI